MTVLQIGACLVWLYVSTRVVHLVIDKGGSVWLAVVAGLVFAAAGWAGLLLVVFANVVTG